MARFMLFIHPGVSAEEYAAGPRLEDVEAMMRYNAELSMAGACSPLTGCADHARRPRGVVDGPFSEAKELLGGYLIIQAEDRAEAVEWASRCPLGSDDFIEVRQIVEVGDLSEELQAAAARSRPAGADRRRDDAGAVEAVWRIESGGLIAGLARMSATSRSPRISPRTRPPSRSRSRPSRRAGQPGRRLIAVAKHRAIDLMRRSRRRVESTPRSDCGWRSPGRAGSPGRDRGRSSRIPRAPSAMRAQREAAGALQAGEPGAVLDRRVGAPADGRSAETDDSSPNVRASSARSTRSANSSRAEPALDRRVAQGHDRAGAVVVARQGHPAKVPVPVGVPIHHLAWSLKVVERR